jgi:hypothetical protein
MGPTNQNSNAFDSYKRDELMFLWFVVESFLLTAFEKILVYYGHCPDFKSLSGARLLMITLEMCKASASLDVDEATAALAALCLNFFPGKSIIDMMNKALCLIKVLRTSFMIPSNTESQLLQKLPNTCCKGFRWKISNLSDLVKFMEYKYITLTPTKLL